MLSQGFEIPELFVWCKPQHFLRVNSKLNSWLHLNFGQITQMTFQNGSCRQLAAANPSS